MFGAGRYRQAELDGAVVEQWEVVGAQVQVRSGARLK